MAHEIFDNDSLFLTIKPAWHGLGTVLAAAAPGRSDAKTRK